MAAHVAAYPPILQPKIRMFSSLNPNLLIANCTTMSTAFCSWSGYGLPCKITNISRWQFWLFLSCNFYRAASESGMVPSQHRITRLHRGAHYAYLVETGISLARNHQSAAVCRRVTSVYEHAVYLVVVPRQ